MTKTFQGKTFKLNVLRDTIIDYMVTLTPGYNSGKMTMLMSSI